MAPIAPVPGRSVPRPAPSAARLRAHHALAAAGLSGLAPSLERVQSNVNEVWLAGPFVLRISPRPESRRLEHEEAVASRLPPGFPYPHIVAHGTDNVAEWLLTERVHGATLSRSWPTMTETRRQESIAQLGAALRTLHAVPPDAGGDGIRMEASPECPHQLPPDRLLELLSRASRLPWMERTVIELARHKVLDCLDALEPWETPGMVHGDLHLENVLWDGDQVVAVLDLEWSRPGPADLDLDVLLRFCADPAPHVSSDYVHLALASDYRSVPRWLRQVYPELFAHPRLNDRLMVYCLAYDVRELLLDPPRGPAGTLHPHHPALRIRRLIEGRSHLPWMEW